MMVEPPSTSGEMKQGLHTGLAASPPCNCPSAARGARLPFMRCTADTGTEERPQIPGELRRLCIDAKVTGLGMGWGLIRMCEHISLIEYTGVSPQKIGMQHHMRGGASLRRRSSESIRPLGCVSPIAYCRGLGYEWTLFGLYLSSRRLCESFASRGQCSIIRPPPLCTICTGLRVASTRCSPPHPCCPVSDPAPRLCQLVSMPKVTKAARFHWADALAGVPSNPAQKQPPSRRTLLRTEARNLIDGKFGLAVGNPLAGLWYTIEDYAETIIICYGFKIEGWPTYIPFRNMSNVGGCEVLSKLIELWTEDVIKFVPATHLDKLNAALDPTLVAPGKGFVHRKHSGGRDDIGRSRYRPKTKPDGGPLRRPKDGPKSAKVVHSDDEDDSQANARPLRLIPLPLLPPFAPSQFVSSRFPGASREVESESDSIEEFSDEE